MTEILMLLNICLCIPTTYQTVKIFLGNMYNILYNQKSIWLVVRESFWMLLNYCQFCSIALVFHFGSVLVENRTYLKFVYGYKVCDRLCDFWQEIYSIFSKIISCEYKCVIDFFFTLRSHTKKSFILRNQLIDCCIVSIPFRAHLNHITILATICFYAASSTITSFFTTNQKAIKNQFEIKFTQRFIRDESNITQPINLIISLFIFQTTKQDFAATYFNTAIRNH